MKIDFTPLTNATLVDLADEVSDLVYELYKCQEKVSRLNFVLSHQLFSRGIDPYAPDLEIEEDGE